MAEHTTTATVEDAVRVITAAMRDGSATTPEDVAIALDTEGLLATARTRPTREQMARAITDGFLGTKRSAEVWQQGTARNVRDNYLRAADAVLALLRGGDRDE